MWWFGSPGGRVRDDELRMLLVETSPWSRRIGRTESERTRARLRCCALSTRPARLRGAAPTGPTFPPG